MYKPKALQNKTIGTWISTGNPLILESILETGLYDWIALDLEHSCFTEPEILNLFSLCERFGVNSFARLHGHDPLQGRKMLDMGATGLIIPVVNNANEIDELCNHFFYPPRGKRGVCLSRINRFGETFNEYFENFTPLIVPQIESQKAVENIKEICTREYVSAVFLGPYDLSADLGTPGDFNSAKVVEALETVKKTVLENNKILGMHVVQPDIEDLKNRFKEGHGFIAYGTDILLLKASLKSAIDLKSENFFNSLNL
jgi:2-keto-3-deoxy-L-rhamnonate aldolase RhmA